MANFNREDAQGYLERRLHDLGLTEGEKGAAVRTQLRLFDLRSGFTAAEFYAIASLVERCVCRALDINPDLPQLEIGDRVRWAVQGVKA